MPKNPTKGAKLVSYELPTELVEHLRAFAEGRGERAKDVVVQALRRHMANPPPPPQVPADPPLPPAPAPAPPQKRGRPRKDGAS